MMPGASKPVDASKKEGAKDDCSSPVDVCKTDREDKGKQEESRCDNLPGIPSRLFSMPGILLRQFHSNQG